MGKAKSRRQKYHASAARGKDKNSAESRPVGPTQSNDIEMAADIETKVKVDLSLERASFTSATASRDICRTIFLDCESIATC